MLALATCPFELLLLAAGAPFGLSLLALLAAFLLLLLVLLFALLADGAVAFEVAATAGAVTDGAVDAASSLAAAVSLRCGDGGGWDDGTGVISFFLVATRLAHDPDVFFLFPSDSSTRIASFDSSTPRPGDSSTTFTGFDFLLVEFGGC